MTRHPIVAGPSGTRVQHRHALGDDSLAALENEFLDLRTLVFVPSIERIPDFPLALGIEPLCGLADPAAEPLLCVHNSLLSLRGAQRAWPNSARAWTGNVARHLTLVVPACHVKPRGRHSGTSPRVVVECTPAGGLGQGAESEAPKRIRHVADDAGDEPFPASLGSAMETDSLVKQSNPRMNCKHPAGTAG